MNTLVHPHDDPQQSPFCVAQPPPPSNLFQNNLLHPPMHEALYGTSPCTSSSNPIRLPSLDNHSSMHHRQATSLAPLRFIIPTSHASTYSNLHRVYPNESRPSTPLTTPHPPTDTPEDSHNSQSLVLESKVSETEVKKSPNRHRIVKNPRRSTKCKARPGLRKGKWTEEEEQYAWQLTMYFKEGLLPVARGTMLRLYLSQKLNCEPMRITKKFTGVECIGKQVFRPASPTPEIQARVEQAEKQLMVLENAFLQKLKENKEEVVGWMDEGGSRTSPKEEYTSDSSADTSSTLKTRKRGVSKEREGEERMDSNAVGLLLDFFYKASRKEGKDKSVKEKSKATGKSEEEPEAEPEAVSEEDGEVEVAGSPTKRLRTLSITNSTCLTDVTMSKRSRIGSISMDV